MMKTKVILWNKNSSITLNETLNNVLRWMSKQGYAIRFITQSESVEGLGNLNVTVIIWYEESEGNNE